MPARVEPKREAGVTERERGLLEIRFDPLHVAHRERLARRPA